MTPREVKDCHELLPVKFAFESQDKKAARLLFYYFRMTPPMIDVRRAHWIYRLIYRYSLQIPNRHPEEWWRYVEKNMFRANTSREVRRKQKKDWLERKAAGTLRPVGRPKQGKPLWQVFAEEDAKKAATP